MNVSPRPEHLPWGPLSLCALLLLPACGGTEVGSPPSAGDSGVAILHEGGKDSTLANDGTTSTEVCDGLDNNQDGRVDEGCTCKAGSSQACFPGLAVNRNVGECKDGKQTCAGTSEFGAWGECLGARLPQTEVTDSRDNDCNGKVDDLCGSGANKTELCGNGLDDDCDGKVDCADPDCPGCAEKNCHDKMDNDSDGLTDCADPDCPPCQETNCQDGLDNDQDGLVDCKDPDCPACGETNCADGVDNDNDGLADCKDPDCQPCAGETACADGLDNDNDGRKDCLDGDCASAPNCQGVCGSNGECCNGKDDNGNGKVDEGNVCQNVGEPCPPGAHQMCDCYCGVYRVCSSSGTWGPCLEAYHGCLKAPVTSHTQCSAAEICDVGECKAKDESLGTECKIHGDCPLGKVCDLGNCVEDEYPSCQ